MRPWVRRGEEIGGGVALGGRRGGGPVAVGEEGPPTPRDPRRDVGDVRDDQIDAQHLLLGEHEAGVDDDEVFAKLEDHHVLADLAEAAQGDYAQLFGHARGVASAPAQAPEPPAPAAPRAPAPAPPVSCGSLLRSPCACCPRAAPPPGGTWG